MVVSVDPLVLAVSLERCLQQRVLDRDERRLKTREVAPPKGIGSVRGFFDGQPILNIEPDASARSSRVGSSIGAKLA